MCNLGTAFGMGLIVTTFMVALGPDYILPALLGNVGAIVGSIVSVRLMLAYTKKYYAAQERLEDAEEESVVVKDFREIRKVIFFNASWMRCLKVERMELRWECQLFQGF